jgi:hypothetical protein
LSWPETLRLFRPTFLELLRPEGIAHQLYDRQGNKVYYEILVNDIEHRIILHPVKNQPEKYHLNSLAGQREYAKDNQDASFEHGQCRPRDTYDVEGAMELKLAWKPCTVSPSH